MTYVPTFVYYSNSNSCFSKFATIRYCNFAHNRQNLISPAAWNTLSHVMDQEFGKEEKVKPVLHEPQLQVECSLTFFYSLELERHVFLFSGVGATLLT